MVIKDLKKNTYKKQKIEMFVYPNKKTGFGGFMKTYTARRIPKKYDNLEVVYWATEHRADVGCVLVVDCKQH